MQNWSRIYMRTLSMEIDRIESNIKTARAHAHTRTYAHAHTRTHVPRRAQQPAGYTPCDPSCERGRVWRGGVRNEYVCAKHDIASLRQAFPEFEYIDIEIL